MAKQETTNKRLIFSVITMFLVSLGSYWLNENNVKNFRDLKIFLKLEEPDPIYKIGDCVRWKYEGGYKYWYGVITDYRPGHYRTVELLEDDTKPNIYETFDVDIFRSFREGNEKYELIKCPPYDGKEAKITGDAYYIEEIQKAWSNRFKTK